MPELITYTQSGSKEPNMFDGLLLWLDISEQGTISRNGTKARKVFDKSKHNSVLISPSDISQPSILQSRFQGKTALKFYTTKEKLVGTTAAPSEGVTTIGVINGYVQINNEYVISISQNLVTVPVTDFVPPMIVAELLVFKTGSLTIEETIWIVNYLMSKWDVPLHSE